MQLRHAEEKREEAEARARELEKQVKLLCTPQLLGSVYCDLLIFFSSLFLVHEFYIYRLLLSGKVFLWKLNC